jgi:hypothetical protein
MIKIHSKVIQLIKNKTLFKNTIYPHQVRIGSGSNLAFSPPLALASGSWINGSTAINLRSVAFSAQTFHRFLIQCHLGQNDFIELPLMFNVFNR